MDHDHTLDHDQVVFGPLTNFGTAVQAAGSGGAASGLALTEDLFNYGVLQRRQKTEERAMKVNDVGK